MDKLWLIAVGGALGATLRYGITEWSQQRISSSFPYGTMIVNLGGAFLIGILMSLFIYRADTPPWLKYFLITGGLGGLTTFSTFSLEWVQLMGQGDYVGAFSYGLVQVIGGLLLCWFGLVMGKLLLG